MSEQAKTGILLVCMGNICRSPMAQGVLHRRARAAGIGDRFMLDSAGTHGYHVGAPPDQRARAAAAERGYDIADLRARQVEPGDLATFDYILAMDRGNLSILQSLAGREPVRAELRLFMDFAPGLEGTDVPDPYYGGVNGFEQVLDLVEKASEGLLTRLLNERADVS